MINRAIYDQMTKKEIVFVSDIYTPYDKVHHLYNTDTVADWYQLNEMTTHTRFPVIDEKATSSGWWHQKMSSASTTTRRLKSDDENRPPSWKTSPAYVAHLMVWEGWKSCPLSINQNCSGSYRARRIKSVERSAAPTASRETIHDIISRGIEQVEGDPDHLRGGSNAANDEPIGTLRQRRFNDDDHRGLRPFIAAFEKREYGRGKFDDPFRRTCPDGKQFDHQTRAKLDAGRLYAKLNVDIYNGQTRRHWWWHSSWTDKMHTG